MNWFLVKGKQKIRFGALKKKLFLKK